MALIRGYILPKRGLDNSPVYAELIDGESAKKMFEELIDLIEGVLNVFTNSSKKRITDPNELSLFLDFLIAYFKSFIFTDPIPSEAGFTLPVSLQDLCLYLSKRELKSYIVPYKKEGLDRLEEISKYAGETVKFLYSEEKRKKFIDVIRFPADTRPGPNTSSLLIHSLTTSALASTHYINKNGVDENLVIIRLAAIFHDIGKLLNWRRHEEISSKKMEELFDTYVDGDARKLVLEASRLISDDKHSLREFLDYGDRKSSGLDRVIKLFIKIIKKSSLYSDLENCLKDYTKTDLEEAFKDWAFWEKYVKEELIKKLTEEFCKTASIIDKENLVFVEESKIVDEDVIFVRVDMRRIQQFIRLNDLWAMNGASRLIDLILYVGIPAYLVDFIKLPLENILYFGGGNETIVFPRKLIGKNEELIHQFIDHFNNEFFKGSPSKIIFGTSPFYDDFRSINLEIDRKLAAKKIGCEDSWNVDLNIYEKCEFCGTAPATIDNNGNRICNLCKERRQFGERQHFRERSRLLGLNWDELQKNVIEYIAGHSSQEPKLGEKYLNLSMVKFDGILIGQIMSSSISLTDACERSFRIDFSVKDGIRKFLTKLLDLNERDDFNRVVLGLMYASGDDGVVLLPARLSIPFVLNLMNEYHLNMGCRSALAVGVIAAKPKHPLIHLYEACDSLLGIAKKAREDCYEKLHKTPLLNPSDAFRGSLAFLTADGGWVTDESVKLLIEEAYNEGVSRMRDSYYLSNVQNERSIIRLLNIVEYDNKINLNDLSLDRLLKVIGEGGNDNEKEEKISRLKKIRNVIHDIFASSRLKVEPGKIKLIYVIREAETAPIEVRELMKVIKEEMIFQVYKKMNQNINFNFYDLFILIKLLGGGSL